MTDDEKETLLECARSLKTGNRINWSEVRYRMASHGYIGKRPEQWRTSYRSITGKAHKARKERANAEKQSKLPRPVAQNFEPKTLDVAWNGNRVVRFALMGDTHLNSVYAQITYLHEFYAECERQGIKHVYNTGDIDDGEMMRPGHQYKCYTQGADDHLREIVTNYPRVHGITTHFITGNHDASLIKRCGYNIGYAIARERPDMEYLGPDCARVKLTPNCILELQHPWNGSSYAISYRSQKIVDAMEGGTKPNILAIGHFHKAEYLFYRNIHVFQTGTFCAQTDFMHGKGLSAHMGGWIVEIEVDQRGYIQRIIPQFIPYYVALENDWRNWKRAM